MAVAKRGPVGIVHFSNGFCGMLETIEAFTYSYRRCESYEVLVGVY